MSSTNDEGSAAAATDGAGPRPHGPQTVAVHSTAPCRVLGACVPPIFQAATFQYEGTEKGYNDVRYTRCNNNPTQLAVATQLAALEGAEAALPVASGMAAISSTLLHVLGPGDHLIITKSPYGGTFDLVWGLLKRWGVETSGIGPRDAPEAWDALVRPGKTRAIYVEAVSNPLCEVFDLEAVVAFARKHKILSIIDGTFATPINFKPVALGFDIVLHSATKFLNGHSDLIAGAVLSTRERIIGITETANLLGPAIDPHAAFLLSRGLRTLGLRVARQNANALAVAELLSRSPKVSAVNYPGLPGSPWHARAARLFSGGGCGGVLSFELAGGVDAAETMLGALTLALVAPSLGGIETLVTRPATTSHAGLTPAERVAAGIGEGLVRVAVGLEDTEDLVADFAAALEKV